MDRRAEILKRLEELNQDIPVGAIAQLGIDVPKDVIQQLDSKTNRNLKLLVEKTRD